MKKGSTIKKAVLAIIFVVTSSVIIITMVVKDNTSLTPQDRSVEITEHVDEDTGQKFTEVKPVGEPEPTYKEASKPAPTEQVQESTPVSEPETVFDARAYATSELQNSLPAQDNPMYLKWQLPCMEELIEKTIGWNSTKAQIDSFFANTAKYTSVCSALQTYKVSGKY